MKTAKRIIFLCVCAVLALSLCSCNLSKTISEVQNSALNAVEGMSMPKIEAPSLIQPESGDAGDFLSVKKINVKSKNYDNVDITAGFDALESDKQRSFYRSIEIGVYVVGSKKNDSGLYSMNRIYLESPLSEKEIRVTLSAFKNDHPEVFWLSNQFSYIPSNMTEVQLYSDISSKEIEKKRDDLITAINFFINKIPAGLSEFERELEIHNLLLNTCSYNESVESTSDDWRPFSIYGALVEGSAVCEGYSRAMQYLLSIFGIECNTINGLAQDNPHQWNVVKIDGMWYHLDATWNDTTENSIYYDYFNVSKDVINNDHEIAAAFPDLSYSQICGDSENEPCLFNVFIPECTSEQANFYTRNSVLFDGINENCTSRVEAQIQSCIDCGGKTVYLMIDNSIDYNEAINMLFYDQPFQFFVYIADINEHNGGVINEEAVSLLPRERMSIIEVQLQYNY